MKDPTKPPPVDPEKAVREAAIDRFIRGERPATICRAIQRSPAWFYRILARYRQGGARRTGKPVPCPASGA